MSAVNDALTALRNVVLMQDRLDVLRTDIARTTGDIKSLTDKVYSINDRVLRIETMIEMSGRGTVPPRIEG